MPSLNNRPNGITRHPLKGSRGNYLVKGNSSLYEDYLALRSDDKAIMDTLLSVATTDTNHFIAANDTLRVIAELSGYAPSTIMSSIKRLKALHLINSLQLPYEYVINPLFAIKGSECEIWKFIQTAEYYSDIPKSVHITCDGITLTANY
jgi:hypothetical protein